MKKVFLGFSALGIAMASIAFSAASKGESSSTSYYFQLTANGGTVPIPTSSTPPTSLPAGWCGSGGRIPCAAEFTSYTLTSGLTKYTSNGIQVEEWFHD